MSDRQWHEKKPNLAAEKEIIAVVGPYLGATGYRKMNPMVYGIDKALVNSEQLIDGHAPVVAYCEVKDRTENNGQRGLVFGYGSGYWIAAQKTIKATQLSESTGLRCWAGVRFRGGKVGICDFHERLPGAIWAGRTDRGEAYDQEPEVILPWDKFIIISDGL